MNMGSFNLFLDQQKRFSDALSDYDHTIWFPPLRGRFEEDNPGNWFIAFVPASWGCWKGATYGVHVDFMYARPRRSLPARIRLAIGVETPMRAARRQAFKEDVILRVKAQRIALTGLCLQAQARKKLMEADPVIPFNERSWHISLQRYIAMQPLVEIIATIVREYDKSGAFDVPTEF